MEVLCVVFTLKIAPLDPPQCLADLLYTVLGRNSYTDVYPVYTSGAQEARLYSPTRIRRRLGACVPKCMHRVVHPCSHSSSTTTAHALSHVTQDAPIYLFRCPDGITRVH